MNDLTLQFSQISIIVSLSLRVVTAGILLLVIYLQIKEAAVKNGLRVLRRQLLIFGVVLFLINTIGIFIIPARDNVDAATFRKISEAFAIINSVGFLVISLVMLQIYRQHYSQTQKEIHEIIEKLERGEVKIVALRQEIKDQKQELGDQKGGV